jgi:TonB family protein
MIVLESVLVSWLAGYLLNSLWQIPLIFAAAWVAARLARPIGPRVEHRVWVSALIAEVALPLCNFQADTLWPSVLSFLSALFHQGVARGPHGSHIRVIVGPAIGSGNGLLFLPTAMITAILAAYVCAVFYFAGRLLLGLFRSHQMLRESHTASLTQYAAKRLEEYESAAGAGPVRLAISSIVSGPVTIGIFRRALLLPSAFLDSVSEADLDAVLAHEFAHIRRRDFAKNVLYGVFSLPAAYHPALWFTNARLSETREMVCDEMAAVTGQESYARSLLRLASMLSDRMPANTLPAIGIFDANSFERRVMNLAHKRSEIPALGRLGIVAACVLVAMTACASALALRMDVNAPNAQQNPKLIHVKPGLLKPTSQVNPVYPEEAKANKISGSVVLDVVIDKRGAPAQMRVVRGPRELQKSALDAVKQWRWQPYLLNGEPIEVETTTTVLYLLGN